MQLIYSDICEPMSVKARNDAPYFVTFIVTHVSDNLYLITYKSDALHCFRLYIFEVENQLAKSVKALRTYRGWKYLSDEF